ncbi:hypothetical protein QZH41_002992 [Actinostola sp. cb2023]|nr:hypothetical protein QZH41_002992 [Actinostola sp. cb2023]
MLQKIHQNHFGIEKCKRRARDVLYWPGMSSQIADMVSKCGTCLRFRNNQPKEPMIGHKVPERPWQRIALDLFHLDGEEYLVISDYYSKYFEITKLTSTTSAAIIRHLKPHLARHGIPDEIITDNGPQFASSQFHDFSQEYHFKHITSSPRYPQSNGLAERTVQTAKQILKKAKYDGSDPNLALLNIRNTPIEGVGLSPAQLLMGRRTRTLLPTSGSLLHPSSYNYRQVTQNLQERQVKQKEYYDRGSKPLNPLRPGDQIHLRDESQNIWIPGTVTAKTEQPRSYIVDVNGSQYRRNRRDILDARDPTNTDPLPTVVPQEPQEPEDLAPNYFEDLYGGTANEPKTGPQMNPGPQMIPRLVRK